MATIPGRLLLQGVPRVRFYQGGSRCPEDIPFPPVMRALLEYFGDKELGCRSGRPLPAGCPVNCSYAFFGGLPCPRTGLWINR